MLHGNYMSIVHAYLCMMIHNCCHLDISLNKLALLWGEAQLCLPYIYLKKEKEPRMTYTYPMLTYTLPLDDLQ